MSKLFGGIPEYILELAFFGGLLLWSIKIQEHVHFLVLQFLIKFANVVDPWNVISTELSLKVDHNIVLSLFQTSHGTLWSEDNRVNEHFTFIHLTLTNGTHIVQHGVNTLNGRIDSIVTSKIGIFKFVRIRQKVLID